MHKKFDFSFGVKIEFVVVTKTVFLELSIDHFPFFPSTITLRFLVKFRYISRLGYGPVNQEFAQVRTKIFGNCRYFTKMNHVLKEKIMILKKKYETFGKFKGSVGWTWNDTRDLGIVKEQRKDTFINTKKKKWLE